MVHILRVIIAFTVAFFCVAGHAGQIYTYSYTFASGDQVTGSFNGTANGNLVTGLSNITAIVNGTPFNGSGSLFGTGLDVNGDYVAGGAVASTDLAFNNFMFVDSNYPDDTALTNFFGLLAVYSMAFVSDFNTYIPAAPLADGQWSLTLLGDDGVPGRVPEPAPLALISAGIAILATTRRKRGLSGQEKSTPGALS